VIGLNGQAVLLLVEEVHEDGHVFASLELIVLEIPVKKSHAP